MFMDLEPTDMNDLVFNETVEIKGRKELILEMYKNAKQKAKMARNLALLAYLEKNQIKSSYMLQDIESDDDEDDI